MSRAIDAVQALNNINWHHRPTPVNQFDSGFNQGLNQAMWEITHAPTLTPPNEKPPCYLPEKDNPYPLCEGRGMKACAHCCLWEDYDPEEDESRVNQPLTMWRLREMDGEPAYIPETNCWVLVTKNPFVPLFTWPDGEQCSAYDWYEQVGPVYRRPPEGEEAGNG